MASLVTTEVDAVDRELIARYIDMLSPEHRDIVNGLYYERVSIREMARRLDMDPASVRWRRDQALKALKRYIEDAVAKEL